MGSLKDNLGLNIFKYDYSNVFLHSLSKVNVKIPKVNVKIISHAHNSMEFNCYQKINAKQTQKSLELYASRLVLLYTLISHR